MSGDDGDDLITLSGTANTSTLKGGSGGDTIMISNGGTSSTIATNVGDDSISIGTILDGSKVYGGSGNDTVTVTTLSSGVVGGQQGADLVVATRLVSSNVQLAVADEGSTLADTLSVSGLISN